MGTWRASFEILRKDLQIELRTGEVVISTSMFALLVALLTSLSFYVDRQSSLRVAPGVLWIAVTFAGVLAMGRSWSREREHDAIRALLLSPVPRQSIYLGKAMGALVFLTVVEVMLVVAVGVLFSLELWPVLSVLCLLLFLGTVGFVAAGTLFAAMGVRTSARDMLLSVALFPIVAPALLCGVVATRDLLGGVPLAELGGWIRILLAFDIVFVIAGAMLFEPLISD
ncbi:MAG: heme exporter protein CcmB [Myxococcales bacterium]|nr:heme exporter protein CcmB [Myxococcales bacterium]MDD9971831.1 heme exporter protein CcmB [Myxococcales bacterium]